MLTWHAFLCAQKSAGAARRGARTHPSRRAPPPADTPCMHITLWSAEMCENTYAKVFHDWVVRGRWGGEGALTENSAQGPVAGLGFTRNCGNEPIWSVSGEPDGVKGVLTCLIMLWEVFEREPHVGWWSGDGVVYYSIYINGVLKCRLLCYF